MNTNFLQNRMKRLFTEGFTVLDISETLVSFDADLMPLKLNYTCLKVTLIL